MLFHGSELRYNVSDRRNIGERWNLPVQWGEGFPPRRRSRCVIFDALVWHVRLLWSICFQGWRSSKIGRMWRNVGCYSKCDGHIHMVTTARSIGVIVYLQLIEICQFWQSVSAVHSAILIDKSQSIRFDQLASDCCIWCVLLSLQRKEFLSKTEDIKRIYKFKNNETIYK